MKKKDPEKTPEQQQEEELEHLERCYNRVFSTDDGKVVLEDIAAYCSVHTSTFNEGPGATEAMLINEGSRRIFLRIAQMIRMDMTRFYIEPRKRGDLPTESV